MYDGCILWVASFQVLFKHAEQGNKGQDCEDVDGVDSCKAASSGLEVSLLLLYILHLCQTCRKGLPPTVQGIRPSSKSQAVLVGRHSNAVIIEA
jgi:hypothetical protein